MINFEFRPKFINIPINTTVRFTIENNKSSYNSIYERSDGRFFIIYIEQDDIESDPLK